MESNTDLDILAFGAHPDDVELSCAGTLLKAKALGRKIGIIDLTRGELGSRGNADIRAREAAAASEGLGLDIRTNLEMADGFFEVNAANKLLVIQQLRKHKPRIVLCNAPNDRHPDHARGHQLVADACFLAGLSKIITTDSNGNNQEPFRPSKVYAYIQDDYIKPNLVVDIEGYWEKKLAILMCYGSQFYQANSSGPQTPISTKEFLELLYGKCLQYGREAGINIGEGFLTMRVPHVQSIDQL